MLNLDESFLRKIRSTNYMGNSTISLFNRLAVRQIVVFLLTDRCSCSCKMCYRPPSYLKKELTFKEIKTIIDKINKYFHKRPFFSITGGEPFLHKDILDILNYLSESKNPFTINTTLISMPKDFIKKIPKDSSFRVSLHGGEKVHDLITGRDDSYKDALKNLWLLKQKNFTVRVNCVISKHNVSNLLDFYESIKYLDFPINFQHLMWSQENKRNKGNDSLLDKSQTFILSSQMKKIKEISKKDNIHVTESGLCGDDYLSHYCSFKAPKKDMICTEPILRIGPEGDVVSCIGESYGNLYENSIGKILGNPLRKKRVKMISRRFKERDIFPECIKCCKLQKRN